MENQIQIKIENDFKDYLLLKELSPITIDRYMRLLGKMIPIIIKSNGKIDQDHINRFILKQKDNIKRAFLLNFIECFDVHNVRIPRATGRKKRKYYPPLTKKEAGILREELYKKNIRYGFLFDLTYHCGLRRQEATGIQIEDFDLANWKEDRDAGCFLKITGKGKRDRRVVIPNPLMLMIRSWILGRDPEEKQKSKRLFGLGNTGWHRVFHKAVKKTLKRNFTLHDLRRSRAYRWYKSGKDIVVIKERLGHSSISTTQLYIYPDTERVLNTWKLESKLKTPKKDEDQDSTLFS